MTIVITLFDQEIHNPSFPAGLTIQRKLGGSKLISTINSEVFGESQAYVIEGNPSDIREWIKDKVIISALRYMSNDDSKKIFVLLTIVRLEPRIQIKMDNILKEYKSSEKRAMTSLRCAKAFVQAIHEPHTPKPAWVDF